ncbi:unnamed protein product [Auanema sp. JU1783]|nr:unnamed protein product [Auanema sp. JU1783]
MSARSAYVCQIQACNAVLIFCGLGSVGLAGSQFSDVNIFNFRDIDLRLLNWIHALTGLIGIYSLLRSHGSIVTKTLYFVSLVIGVATGVFYGFTTYRIVEAHDNLRQVQQVPGFQDSLGQEDRNYAARIVISSIMIALGALAALVSLVALYLLEKLVVVTSPIYPLQSREQEMAMYNSRKALASVGIIKTVFALGVLGLAVFVEYEHEKVSGTDKYIKIALDHIAAMLAVCSGVMDLYASRGKTQEQLNLKVALALSVVAAVWCIKTVDHNTMPFYKYDLKYYYETRATMLTTSTSPRYILAVAHGVLIGCFGILFFICTLSCVFIGNFLQLDFLSMHLRIEKGLRIQSRLLSFLHILWGACLLALTILGLLDVKWRGEFLGGDLLWMSFLFATTGILSSSNYGTMITMRFILNICCMGISLEKMCASVNLIYQYSSYDVYVNGERKTFIGQIVLISCATAVFGAELLTSTISSIIYGREVARQSAPSYRHSTRLHQLFSLGTLFYAIVITGDYVVFELGKWRYSEVPLDVPFFRLGNGPLALAVFVVQLGCTCYPRLLAASSLLHVVIASLALFTISPAITNVYYLQNLISLNDVLRPTPDQETIYEVALILAAGAALACVIATFCGVICSLRSSYILHHRSASPDSTVVAPLGEEHFGTGQFRTREQSPVVISQASPISIQAREEQSVYWSADENPFYYHTSKRFYGQPYQIESGFYGYALANPNGQEHHHRRVQSSAAQTQIGHVFNN